MLVRSKLDPAKFDIGQTWRIYDLGHAFKVRHYLNCVLVRRKLDQERFDTGKTWHNYAIGHTFAAAERRTSC